MNWQPIDTAPKDGARVLLLFYTDAVASCHFKNHSEGGNWYTDIGFSMLIERPTHWMPLPEPPSE